MSGGLTLRAAAAGAARDALNAGTGRVLGADPAMIEAARLSTIAKAERAVHAALEGPVRFLVSEPDDEELQLLLGKLEARRELLLNR